MSASNEKKIGETSQFIVLYLYEKLTRMFFFSEFPFQIRFTVITENLLWCTPK